MTKLTDNTDAKVLGKLNPFRYRGYYFDNESGLYYLQSRYYDAGTGRFVNADGYASTGQGVLGNNMFVYCGNNPVNRVDPTGRFWGEVWNFVKTVGQEIGNVLSGQKNVVAGCGALALADGPSLVGDIVAAAGILTVGIYSVGQGIYNATKNVTITIPKAEEKEKVNTGTPPKPTVVYRYGGTNPGNFVPSKLDAEKNSGLSFSTIPKPGAAMTTIEALNATGVVYAVRDGATHVSVYPKGGTIQDWRSAGPTSVWTIAVKSVVIKVKWDGGS